MSLEIRMLTLGLASTNAYLIGDTASGAAVLIDPVDDAPRLYQAAQEAGWTIQLILATHAHFDHVLASKALKELTGAPFYIHADGVPWLERLPQQGRMFGVASFPEAAQPDRLLTTAPEVLQVGAIVLHTLYTPGHAPGHLSFFLPSERIVFSGDCLFAGSIGRTDLPGADYDTLMQSIFTQLLPLGDDVRVLAGHNQPTSIGRERKNNPFLMDYDGNDL
ncbi:MAG: MBL fold metallo-hydrolase [Anaerolineae bacterium]|jgi:glyoxylase-like metal-dependent hydrolase (beta-lactamase superfamily II)|nr:MBL fold metallo-hydrolase [Anaerolineae bacterium]